MRNLIPLIILLLFSSCATNKRSLTDLEKIGLLGKVKYLKFIHQSNNKKEESTEPDEGQFIDNEYFFNEKGMISEQRQYVSSEISRIFIFYYDKNNRLISKDYYNSSRELATKSIFKNILNKKGELYKQTEFKAWEKSISDTTKVRYHKFPYEITEYLYDANGKLSQQNHYQSITPFKYVIEYHNGKMVKGTTVDLKNDSIWSSTLYKCLKLDQNQNCIKYQGTEAKIGYYK